MVPCAGGIVRLAATSWPGSGSVMGKKPEKDVLTAIVMVRSLTTGGLFGGTTGTTCVVTCALARLPSLSEGRS
jgi:hypothetical protein